LNWNESTLALWCGYLVYFNFGFCHKKWTNSPTSNTRR